MKLFHIQFIRQNKIWNERNDEDVIIKMVEASVLKFGQMLLSLFNILFVHWFLILLEWSLLTIFSPGGLQGPPKVFVHNSWSFRADSVKFGDFF